MPLTKIDEEEYKICQKRGHETGQVLASIPPKYVCKHCGVVFSYELKEEGK